MGTVPAGLDLTPGSAVPHASGQPGPASLTRSPPSLPPPLWSFACYRVLRGLLSLPEPHRPHEYRPLPYASAPPVVPPPFYPLPLAGPTVITAAQAYALWDVRPTLPYPHAPTPGPLPSAARTLSHMSDPPHLCVPHPTLSLVEMLCRCGQRPRGGDGVRGPLICDLIAI